VKPTFLQLLHKGIYGRICAKLNKYFQLILSNCRIGDKAMYENKNQIYDLAVKGYCCSQIMVKLGLDAMNRENEDLLAAMSGLCKGLFSELTCGTLTGAACLLSLYDKNEAAANMIPRLVEWFEISFSQLYGGINCKDIIGDDPMKRFERCPEIMQNTFEMCRDLLVENGCDI